MVSKEGLLQTKPRFAGNILEPAPVNPTLFGKQTMTFEQTGSDQRKTLFAGTWLKAKDWLLVISGDVEADMAELFATRNVQPATTPQPPQNCNRMHPIIPMHEND